jgi:hypothetical protein
MSRNVWRVLDAAFAFLFAFAVVVQFNDPDPLKWVLIYAAAAWASLLSALGRVTRLLPSAIAAAALLWASTIVPRVVGRVPFRDMFAEWEMQNAGVEESREMYGLLLIALWMGLVAMRATRRLVRPTALPGLIILTLVPQDVSTRMLGAPEAEFKEPFTTISSVRPLRDGCAIVTDRREKLLQLVDLRAQTARPVGRTAPAVQVLSYFSARSVPNIELAWPGKRHTYVYSPGAGTTKVASTVWPGDARVV